MTAVFSLLFCFPPCKTHGTHTSSVCFFSQLTRHKDNRLIKFLVSPHFSHLLVSLSPCLENRDDKSTRAIRQGKKSRNTRHAPHNRRNTNRNSHRTRTSSILAGAFLLIPSAQPALHPLMVMPNTHSTSLLDVFKTLWYKKVQLTCPGPKCNASPENLQLRHAKKSSDESGRKTGAMSQCSQGKTKGRR